MISLKIVTPRGRYLEKKVKSIHLTSVEGEMTVLVNHMPIFASILPCELVLVDESDTRLEYALSGGFFHLEKNEAMLLTDAIEGKGDIDIERAKRAYRRARDRIDKKDSATNMKRANLALVRAMNRSHVHDD